MQIPLIEPYQVKEIGYESFSSNENFYGFPKS